MEFSEAMVCGGVMWRVWRMCEMKGLRHFSLQGIFLTEACDGRPLRDDRWGQRSAALWSHPRVSQASVKSGTYGASR